MTASSVARSCTAALFIGGLAVACGGAVAAPDNANGDSPDHGSTGVDAMALYAEGAAVVQDSRSLNLKAGRQTVNWPVPGPVQADTLWLSGAGNDASANQARGTGVQLVGFQINRHQSQSSGPLAARIGAPVTLTDASGKAEQGQLAAMDGDIAYVRVGGDIRRITAASPTQISWAGGVERHDASASTVLALDLVAPSAGPQTVTATYQMAAPSWQASYTGRFNPASSTLSLQSTAVIDNNTPTALDADKAWLVAGAVSRAGGGAPAPVMMMARAKSDATSAGAPQASDDVYRYPLTGGLHVPAGTTQAVALMAPTRFKVQRVYRFQNYALTDLGQVRQHADVQLTFSNSSDKPLPAGAVRIYDASQVADLMGEARIDDTPTSAPVVLGLGQAFDVTGTHRVVKQTSDTKTGEQSRTITVTMFNAGADARSVVVAENLPDGARITDGAPKDDADKNADESSGTPSWHLNVPAHGQQAVTYTIAFK